MKKGLYIASERCASVSIIEMCHRYGIDFHTRYTLNFGTPNVSLKIATENSPYLNFGSYGKKLAKASELLVGKEEYKSRLVFTSVRNPFSRAVSTWKHHTWSKKQIGVDLTFLQFCKLISEEDFISIFDSKTSEDIPYKHYLNTDLHSAVLNEDGLLKNKWRWANPWWHCFSFHDHFFENGKPLVDKFVKVENIEEDMSEIYSELNIKLLYQEKTNVNSRNQSLTIGSGGEGSVLLNSKTEPDKKMMTKHYTEFYCKESKDIISKKYAKDIEYFNYKYGD